MQCWYWAKLGVDSAIVETAKAVAMKARRIGGSPFQAFPSDCREIEPRAGIQRAILSQRAPAGRQFGVNTVSPAASAPQPRILRQPKIFTSPRSSPAQNLGGARQHRLGRVGYARRQRADLRAGLWAQ